jgi:hypothetical protein
MEVFPLEAHSQYQTGGRAVQTDPGFARRLATETKQAFKTTEFWAYVAILIGLFIAGAVTDSSTTVTTGPDGSSTAVSPDALPADKVWLYAAILTVGYMVSRGLAKAGSRDPYWHQPNSGDGDGSLGERVKTAAQVLKEGDTQSQAEAPRR